jgi:hypothetical protein
MASDMRISYVDATNKIGKQEDSDIKTICLNGRLLLGFTGLARIDGKRIESWLSDILGAVPAEDYVDTIGREISEVFGKKKLAGELPHAFLMVGFLSDASESLAPVAILISNSHDTDWRFTPGEISPNFRTSLRRLENQRQRILTVGWPVKEKVLRKAENAVRHVVRGEPRRPFMTLDPLARLIRETARNRPGLVGESVLFSSLPKVSAESGEGGVIMPFTNFDPATDESTSTHPFSLTYKMNHKGEGETDVNSMAQIGPELHIMGAVVRRGDQWIGPREGY